MLDDGSAQKQQEAQRALYRAIEYHVEKLKHVSANQRPGRPSWISNRRLGRGRWGFLKIRSVVLEKKSKNVTANQSSGGHLGFPIGTKTCTLKKVSSKSMQLLQKRSRKMFQPIRGQGGHLGYPISKKKQKLWDVEDLLPVKFRQNC